MILMNDFKAESSTLREAMQQAANRVIESGWYVLGQELKNFEHEWAQTCGASYGIGVGNGMDAIEIALRSLGIGVGDEVITTSMTAFATVLAILRAGATPVLADIDPNTALLSIESVQRCLSSETKAVVLVHLYGQVRNMHAWVDLCETYKISLIEDCAQAHLARSKGRVAGSLGEAGAYSFYPTKNLGALGDGGMLITNNEAIAQKADCLRNYGQSVRYHHPESGLNSRLDELQAAILLERLKWLPAFTQRRRDIADAYRSGIEHPSVMFLDAPEETAAHVYHLFVITCKAREALQAYLHTQNVQTLIHYPLTINQQAPCKQLACDPKGLKQSEYHANTCISLPCHPQMSDEDVALVIAAVNSFVSQ